ncbi:multicopper oxidase domain-containing protein, partial [Novosphingobium sp. UBA1939]|uniref:multicopper oxidase domain-containing protein n=1 Tax=Novosphingobium sp. UBA1939 TaxID=1946982 RepID=UPI0025FD8E07
MAEPIVFNRRDLLMGQGALALSATLAPLFPAWARGAHGGHHGMAVGPDATTGIGEALSGDRIALTIGESRFAVGKRSAAAVGINGSIPGPLIRLREGQTVRIDVTNRLREQSSIHWHGLLVPFQMDGVPGLSFPGIDPGETF